MPERIQLSQEDEALRQANRDTYVRAGLAYAIQRLTDPRAHHAMTDAARIAIAQRFATDLFGWTEDADELIHDLLAAMPTLDVEDITRGEYAIRLQPKARR